MPPLVAIILAPAAAVLLCRTIVDLLASGKSRR